MEETYFEVRTTHDLNQFKVLAKIEYNTRAGAIKYLFLLGCLILVGVGIASLVMLGFSISAVVTIAVGVGIPFMNVWLIHRLAKMMAKQSGDMEALLTYKFDDTSFWICDRNGEREYQYSELMKVVETEAYYFAYLKSTVCFCLPKCDFRQGSASEFLLFLKDTCRTTCRFFRYPGKLK